WETPMDYARTLMLDTERLSKELAELTPTLTVQGPDMDHLTHGISVIIPTYQGRSRLPRMLASLESQDLPHDLFEVIIIMNGADDGSLEFLREYAGVSDLQIRLFTAVEQGAGHAR